VFPRAAQAATFEDFVIEGEVQKPEVTVLVTRENLNKSYVLDLRRSFLDRILEALERAPF
jgi:hypothetical protein